jgi:hypothetical protein
MSSPDIPELPIDLRRLFDEEKALVPLPDAARARVAARIAETASLPPWSAQALRLARRAGWVAVVFLAGAGAGAGFEHRRSADVDAPPGATAVPATPTSTAANPRVAPEAWHETTAEPASNDTVTPAPTMTSRAAAPSAKSSPSRAPSSLAEERVELETARVAMTRARWDEAAAALDRHARLFPNGQLTEERDSLHVVLLAERGQGTRAREAAARFERLYPTSLFLPAVRAAADSVTDAPGTGQGHQ